MSKLFPPKIEIDIYNDGFEGKDLLNRKKTGERLSELVERIEDPMVIALNGGWGTGKSFFLKCWVGEHTLDNDRTARTVYFDAFAHDYLDNPLIALTGVLTEQLEQEDSKREQTLKKVRSIASKLWRPAARIGLAVATSGISEGAGAVTKIAIDATGAEIAKAAEDFWKEEDGKRAAMNEFTEALKALTLPDTEDATPQKIVIVIDELDRCRPDYALQMLEIIKHFFSVPHIHFILGTNISELENTVKARYGAGVNASLYLEKFINLSMSLPSHTPHQHMTINKAYFNEMAKAMGLGERSNMASYYFELPAIEQQLNLRTVERLLTYLALLPDTITSGRLQNWNKEIIMSLFLMKTLNANLYKKAQNQALTLGDIAALFGPDELKTENQKNNLKYVMDCWKYVFDKEFRNHPDQTKRFGPYGIQSEPQDYIVSIIDKYIEAFDTQLN